MKNLMIFSVITILISSFLSPSLAYEKSGSEKAKIKARIGVTKDVKVVIQISSAIPQIATQIKLININTGATYTINALLVGSEFTEIVHHVTINTGDVFRLEMSFVGLEYRLGVRYTVIPEDLIVAQPTFTFM